VVTIEDSGAYMKIYKTILASTMLSLLAVAPAFAEGDDAEIYTLTEIYNLIDVSGYVEVSGDINVASESGATVDQDQTTLFNASSGDGDNDAHMTDSALQGAEGNIGVNVAAGVGNAQSNDAALSAIDAEDTLATAMVFNSQSTLANFATSSQPDTYYQATLDGDALKEAKGNIGVNIAAGVGNAQSNGLAASVNSSATLSKAVADSEQFAYFNELLADCDLDNFASFSGNALQGAQGNIGVNIAAGVGNAQHNGLAISAASSAASSCDSGCGP
jgi:hypothetical protein